jgi:predicted kinase
VKSQEWEEIASAGGSVFAAHLIMLIGLPGSGKSTLARQLQATLPGYILISTDAIRAALFGDEAIQGSWLLVWREVQRQFHQAVQQIQSGQAQAAIYDATNVVRRDRRQVLTQARSIGFTHITGVWLDPPLAVCLERNQKRDRQVPEAVIQRMHRRLVGAPPSLLEQLDCLVRYPP